VKIRNGRDGSVIQEAMVFDASFKGGVNLAVGNFNGDKVTDIAVGAGMGGGPLVHILNGLNFSDMGSFFAYEPSFRGGVNIATADVDGDGIDEIITGAGNGGSPLVKVFSSRGTALDAFFAYESGLRTGVRVAGEDIDGDGREELITAPLMGIQRIQAFAVGNRDPKLNYFATTNEELPFSLRVG